MTTSTTRGRRLAAGAGLAVLIAAGAARGAPGPALWPASARYDLTLRAARSGVLAGREHVSFANPRAVPAPRVWLRVWGNGPGGCARPRVRVRVTGGGRADGWTARCTALRVRLARPAPPGGRGAFTLAVRIDPPHVAARFGRSAGGALYGNAIPVLAVVRGDRPDLDPYIALGDPFFSLTAHWRAAVDVPRGLVAASTGAEVGRAPAPGGGVRVRILAPRARDFALAVGPYRVAAVSSGGVRVRYLAPRGAPVRGRAALLRAAAGSLRAFSRWYGPYPGRELDVVETPGLESEGMEYPELVMSVPDRETLVHEVAHQWWSALVGSDGWRAPWLDETLTTYSQLLLIGGLGRCDVADPLAGYGRARLTWTLGRFARSPRDYGAAYDGGACAMEGISRAWGARRVRRMLRAYAGAHRMGVATGADLVGAMAAAAPPGFDGPAFLARARIDLPWHPPAATGTTGHARIWGVEGARRG